MKFEEISSLEDITFCCNKKREKEETKLQLHGFDRAPA